MLDDKVCEPFASSNHINLLPSAEKNVCIVFFLYGEKRKKNYPGASFDVLEKVMYEFLKVLVH